MKKNFAIITRDMTTSLDIVASVVVVDISITDITTMTNLLTVELPDDAIIEKGYIYDGENFIKPVE